MIGFGCSARPFQEVTSCIGTATDNDLSDLIVKPPTAIVKQAYHGLESPSMKLPNGEQAMVDDGKLLDYVLSPTHPIGRHHAALFARVLGITQQNYEILKRELLRAAASETVTSGKPSPYGLKYEMRLTIEGPRGHANVLAVWLVEHGEERPRMITCYLE